MGSALRIAITTRLAIATTTLACVWYSITINVSVPVVWFPVLIDLLTGGASLRVQALGYGVLGVLGALGVGVYTAKLA